MSYNVEVRLASKNGYHTPAEARAYYGRYDRHGITWHWWGDPALNPDSAHDRIVDYILGKAAKGTGSVNAVLSNNKITRLVSWDNVAWASQGGNPTTVSVELSPHLNAEGYKKAGWLAAELARYFGGDRKYYPHNYWYATQCPGTISLDRIRQEEDKWQRGDYNPKPPVTPPKPPAKAVLEWTLWKEGPITYVTNKQPTTLWNFDQTTWAGFGNGVSKFDKGAQITIVGEVINKTLGAKYLLTEYSFSKKITNGFNAADLEVYVPPRPIPEPPVEEPQVPPPYTPEWEAKLRDIDDTTFWFKEDTELIDITTGKPAGPTTKRFSKDEEFVCSALTVSNGVEYRITDYSFKKGIFNGVPTDKLTLTPPGVPDIPPVPVEPEPEKIPNWFIKLMQDFIKWISNKFGIGE